MKQALYAATVTIFVLASLCLAVRVQAQSGTKAEIVFTEQNKEEARHQLNRLLSEYDLDPWIFTREVRIEAGMDPRSKPILTLNTDYLDDDLTQLSIFLHEQAHWLPEAKREAAVQELREVYPEIPGIPEESQNYAGSKRATYHHLIVAWVELDAMTELVGEEKARRILEKKVHDFAEEPYSAADRSFLWYNKRVLEDTHEIGRILAKHDLLITPERGLVIETDE